MNAPKIPDVLTDDDIAKYIATNGRERLRWFVWEEMCAAEKALPISKQHIDFFLFRASDLHRIPNPPEWFRRELEYKFRRGFHDGYYDAVENMQALAAKGYSRVREIGNIFCHFLGELQKWKRRTWTDDIADHFYDHSTPPLKQESWWDLRKAVLERDGHQCVRCDRTEKLEVDHETPVAEGGFAQMKNLRTLCFGCHRGAPDIEAEKPDGLTDEQADSLLPALTAVTGVPWEWVDCDEASMGGRWQLMTVRGHEDATDDFWWWHIGRRRQYFNNRLNAIASFIKSYRRWQELARTTAEAPRV